MTAIRLAVLSDVHGNALALAAVRQAIRAAGPDAILVAGDHALNGPDPAATVDVIRELEAAGALVIAGNTDVAVADFDYAAAFPWLGDGIPDAYRYAAEWAHDERSTGARRLAAPPAVGAAAVVRRHARAADPRVARVQTAGFDQHLDPTVVTERLARTDAVVVCCGHTHMPEVRDLGWKMIVERRPGAGYVFDGEPTASWAVVEIEAGEVRAEIRRTPFDELAVANAISARGLPGDVYRAATVRTGKLVR